MGEKEATRRSCHYDRAWVSTQADTRIVPDFERGSYWAAIALAATFLLMGMGAVVLGW